MNALVFLCYHPPGPASHQCPPDYFPVWRLLSFLYACSPVNLLTFHMSHRSTPRLSVQISLPAESLPDCRTQYVYSILSSHFCLTLSFSLKTPRSFISENKTHSSIGKKLYGGDVFMTFKRHFWCSNVRAFLLTHLTIRFGCRSSNYCNCSTMMEVNDNCRHL